MISKRTMTVDREHSRALVVQYPQPGGPLTIRNSDLAVIPPRPLPLTLKAQRSLAKFTKFGILAAICGFCGYAYRDTGIRRAVDYRVTMLTTPGVSAVSPTFASHTANFEPLPAHAKYLFADNNQKGPRADKFASALKSGFASSVTRRTKTDPLNLPRQPVVQTAALAGAELFLSAFTPQDPLLEGDAASAQKTRRWRRRRMGRASQERKPFAGAAANPVRRPDRGRVPQARVALHGHRHLLRGARRAGQGPDRGRAGHHEPHPQPLLSRRRFAA